MHKFHDEQTGRFWQVIDHPKAESNYLETSGTALFAYAVLKGVGSLVLAYTEMIARK